MLLVHYETVPGEWTSAELAVLHPGPPIMKWSEWLYLKSILNAFQCVHTCTCERITCGHIFISFSIIVFLRLQLDWRPAWLVSVIVSTKRCTTLIYCVFFIQQNSLLSTSVHGVLAHCNENWDTPPVSLSEPVLFDHQPTGIAALGSGRNKSPAVHQECKKIMITLRLKTQLHSFGKLINISFFSLK